MRNLLLTIFIFFVISVTYAGQINYPFLGKENNRDIQAYWYNDPSNSANLNIGEKFILQSALRIYGRVLEDSKIKINGKTKLEVMYSKNIEVFCTLINLTDYWEKRPTDFPIAIEARERFLPFKNHRAVRLTSKFLKKQWVWHQFFCHLALYYTDFPEAKCKYAFQLTHNRFFNWAIKKIYRIENYIEAIRDFYKESNYENFWQEKRGFYGNLKASFEEKILGINIFEIMEDFYGMKKDYYFIVPAPQMPSMGLNVEIMAEEKHLVYAVLSPVFLGRGNNFSISSEELVEWTFHEFGHTFLEPLLRHYKGLLKKHSYIYKKITQENREKMKNRGYQSWDRVFIENLLRAIQARLTKEVFGEKYSQKIIEREMKKGFQLVHVLYCIIGEYEKNREKYRNFEVFIPTLFNRLKEKMGN